MGWFGRLRDGAQEPPEVVVAGEEDGLDAEQEELLRRARPTVRGAGWRDPDWRSQPQSPPQQGGIMGKEF